MSLTEAQVHRMHVLENDVQAIRKAVYEVTERTDVRLSDCLDMAAPALRLAYCAAHLKLAEFEDRMIREGRGYRNSVGLLVSY
jgi:hypothetical protein